MIDFLGKAVEAITRCPSFAQIKNHPLEIGYSLALVIDSDGKGFWARRFRIVALGISSHVDIDIMLPDGSYADQFEPYIAALASRIPK